MAMKLHNSPSDPVLEAVKRSIALSDQLNAIHPSTIQLDVRSDMAARLLSICLDHREAIILLAQHGANTSAFALARSCYEAAIRGIWTHAVASDSEVIQTSEGYFPKFETVVKQVRKNELFKPLGEMKALVWPALSGFAHGGHEQVSRWASEDGIEPVHTDTEVID
jgi:hypothetical protein